MNFKLQKDECPPGKYWTNRNSRFWGIEVLSDGTIFIKPIDSISRSVESPDNWCSDCEIKNFKSNFGNWTGGNKMLDQIIQRSQSNVKGPLDYLEWIPFTEFSDIKFVSKGGFGCVESAIWNLGPRWSFEPSSRKWKRNGPYKVALKTVNDSHQYLQEFLNEVRAHYICTSEDNHLPHCFGITQNPKSKNYVMVLEYAHYDHVHQDFHSGNILIYQKDGKLYPTVEDLGLCRPLNKINNEGKIYGIMLYIAPEVIRGLGNTKAADIYSLGIIMWEILTGERPYKDQPHDAHLAFKILDGLRPTIPEGTPNKYRNLMQKCWNRNPAERSTAEKIKQKVINLKKSLNPNLKRLKGPVCNNGEDSSSLNHSEAYYTSRHLSLDELRGESCQHPEWPGKGWDLLKKEPIISDDQKMQEAKETQYKYVNREYDLSLDNDFLIKDGGGLSKVHKIDRFNNL
ncbi:kinase-like domain-containing protein [Rhizophagus clarus]|uniref:Kinase-like domain-containing protein n=1 Tax=Rhizophagus clarus TaxID=94130 RepID=A0A8H3LMU6_9GLOM|nr:kinase-like domain-containing protein [Rhizophagus clarus]